MSNGQNPTQTQGVPQADATHTTQSAAAMQPNPGFGVQGDPTAGTQAAAAQGGQPTVDPASIANQQPQPSAQQNPAAVQQPAPTQPAAQVQGQTPQPGVQASDPNAQVTVQAGTQPCTLDGTPCTCGGQNPCPKTVAAAQPAPQDPLVVQMARNIGMQSLGTPQPFGSPHDAARSMVTLKQQLMDNGYTLTSEAVQGSSQVVCQFQGPQGQQLVTTQDLQANTLQLDQQ